MDRNNILPMCSVVVSSARAEGRNNYTHVFDNETLRRISEALPLTVAELGTVEGVVAIKADRYWDRFLPITIKYANSMPGRSAVCNPSNSMPGMYAVCNPTTCIHVCIHVCLVLSAAC